MKQISQRHYSPDQLQLNEPTHSHGKSSKKLREGGSTSKFLESASRYRQEEVLIGDYFYRPSEEIGAGYSSRVYRASDHEGHSYAIKVIDMKRFSASGLEMLENEIEILRQLDHPSVIKLYHVHRTQTHTYLVTELCKEGDLLEYMARRGPLGEEEAVGIMSDVIEGVKYLFKMGVIHRDLKPANILRGDKVWKIADFGFSIRGREEVRTRQNVGTPLYMPLESLLKNLYSPESDIFAIGIMYYQLLVGITPWQCRSEKELIKKLATVPFSVPQRTKLSVHIKFLLQKMCSVDGSQRMRKEQFSQLNLKNFVSLVNFNDPNPPPPPPPKKPEEHRRLIIASPAKAKSKGKARQVSKEKPQKLKEYKLNRRKKSTQKEPRKRSTDKQVKNKEGSSMKTINSGSLLPETEASERFDLINERILTNQLDYSRFLFYLIQHQDLLPLPQQSLKRLNLILLKHMLKIVKQLAEGRNNYFKLPNWDTFRQSPKFKSILATMQEYCEKYEREYLKHLKESEISVIKDVNQRFSQLGSSECLSLNFYQKLQTLVSSALKDCLLGCDLASSSPSPHASGTPQAVKALLRYYRWIQLNVSNYENYAMQKTVELTIIKNFRTVDMGREQRMGLVEEINSL